jgi:hypothetical protein
MKKLPLHTRLESDWVAGDNWQRNAVCEVPVEKEYWIPVQSDAGYG